jgi:integrase
MNKYAIVRILDDETPFWLDFTPHYLLHAKLHNKASTIRCMIRPAIKAFSDFVGNPRLGDVVINIVTAYKLSMVEMYKPNYIRTRLAAVSAVFSYAVDQEIIGSNPFLKIEWPKQTNAGRNLKDDEIRKLFSLMSHEAQQCCKFALYTGLRTMEVISLEWSQVGEETVHIPDYKAKSGKERYVYMKPKVRDILGPRGTGHVFAITVERLRVEIKRAWTQAGLGKIRFHDMRHTAASRYGENSDDVLDMLYQFGWASVRSAKTYHHSTIKRMRAGMLGVDYDF